MATKKKNIETQLKNLLGDYAEQINADIEALEQKMGPDQGKLHTLQDKRMYVEDLLCELSI